MLIHGIPNLPSNTSPVGGDWVLCFFQTFAHCISGGIGGGTIADAASNPCGRFGGSCPPSVGQEFTCCTQVPALAAEAFGVTLVERLGDWGGV